MVVPVNNSGHASRILDTWGNQRRWQDDRWEPTTIQVLKAAHETEIEVVKANVLSRPSKGDLPASPASRATVRVDPLVGATAYPSPGGAHPILKPQNDFTAASGQDAEPIEWLLLGALEMTGLSRFAEDLGTSSAPKVCLRFSWIATYPST